MSDFGPGHLKPCSATQQEVGAHLQREVFMQHQLIGCGASAPSATYILLFTYIGPTSVTHRLSELGNMMISRFRTISLLLRHGRSQEIF